MLELKRIGHGGYLLRIAAQNFHFFRVLVRVLVLGDGTQLAGEVLRREVGL